MTMLNNIEGFEFDKESHIYRLNGVKIPSVTEVLELINPNTGFYSEEAAERGTAVHEITADIDRGLEVEYPLEYAGFIDAWEYFKLEYDLGVAEIIETPFLSKYCYAGTVDRIYIKHKIVLDIKTGLKTKTHIVQLEAYTKMIKEYEEYKKIKFEMMAVYLHNDGSYIAFTYKPNSKIYAKFQCYLTTFKDSKAKEIV